MKASEFRQLSKEEILKKINDFEKELFELRFQKAVAPIDKPARIPELRKDIARAKTILNEKSKSEA